MVAAVAAATGRPEVQYVPVPAAALAAFVPPYLLQLLTYVEALGDKAVPLSHATRDITGHQTDFAAWLATNAAAFA